MRVKIEGKEVATGTGKSKKEAERMAAANALKMVESLHLKKDSSWLQYTVYASDTTIFIKKNILLL